MCCALHMLYKCPASPVIEYSYPVSRAVPDVFHMQRMHLSMRVQLFCPQLQNCCECMFDRRAGNRVYQRGNGVVCNSFGISYDGVGVRLIH